MSVCEWVECVRTVYSTHVGDRDGTQAQSIRGNGSCLCKLKIANTDIVKLKWKRGTTNAFKRKWLKQTQAHWWKTLDGLVARTAQKPKPYSYTVISLFLSMLWEMPRCCCWCCCRCHGSGFFRLPFCLAWKSRAIIDLSLGVVCECHPVVVRSLWQQTLEDYNKKMLT